MVNAREVEGWSWSPAILFGKTSKIEVQCGECGKWHSTRISLEAVKRGNSYVVCPYCGEVNDTKIRYC